MKQLLINIFFLWPFTVLCAIWWFGIYLPAHLFYELVLKPLGLLLCGMLGLLAIGFCFWYTWGDFRSSGSYLPGNPFPFIHIW